MITQTEIQQVLYYDPLTGEFTWKTRPVTDHFVKIWNTRYAGKHAGTTSHNYEHIFIHGKNYFAHHLAWCYVTGEWPSLHIDHIDGNKINNKFANLRLATFSQNMINRPLSICNKTGVKGVYRNKKTNAWYAQIKANKVTHHLGTFSTFEEALNARKTAEQKLHKEFVFKLQFEANDDAEDSSADSINN